MHTLNINLSLSTIQKYALFITDIYLKSFVEMELRYRGMGIPLTNTRYTLQFATRTSVLICYDKCAIQIIIKVFKLLLTKM